MLAKTNHNHQIWALGSLQKLLLGNLSESVLEHAEAFRPESGHERKE